MKNDTSCNTNSKLHRKGWGSKEFYSRYGSNVKTGHYTINDNKLQVSWKEDKYFTYVYMRLESPKPPFILKSYSKRNFNFERILPLKFARKIVIKQINKQSKWVAGINLV